MMTDIIKSKCVLINLQPCDRALLENDLCDVPVITLAHPDPVARPTSPAVLLCKLARGRGMCNITVWSSNWEDAMSASPRALIDGSRDGRAADAAA